MSGLIIVLPREGAKGITCIISFNLPSRHYPHRVDEDTATVGLRNLPRPSKDLNSNLTGQHAFLAAAIYCQVYSEFRVCQTSQR